MPVLWSLTGIVLFSWVMNKYEDWSSASMSVLDCNRIFPTPLKHHENTMFFGCPISPPIHALPRHNPSLYAELRLSLLKFLNPLSPQCLRRGPRPINVFFFLRLKTSTHVWEVYPITGPHSWSLQFRQGDWWMQFCTGTEYLPTTISLRCCWRELGRKQKF